MNQRGGRGHAAPRGRSPRHHRPYVGADGYHVDDSFGISDGMSRGGRTNPQQRSRGGVSNRFEPKPSQVYRPKPQAVSTAAGFSNVVGVGGYPVDDSFDSNDGMSRGGRVNPQQRSWGGVSNRYQPKPSTVYVYRPKEGQSFVNPTGGVSKPPEFVASVSVLPNDPSVLSSQHDAKDVHLGARTIENGSDTGDSVELCHQDESRSDPKSVKEGVKNTEYIGNPHHHGNKKEVGADVHHGVDSFGSNNGMSRGGKTNLQQRSPGGVAKHFEQKPSPMNMYKQKQQAMRGGAGFSNVVRHHQGQCSVVPKPSESIDLDSSVLSSQPDPEDVHMGARTIQGSDAISDSVALHRDFSDKVKVMSHGESGFDSKSGAGNSDHPEKTEDIKGFDLCPSKGGSSIKLKPSLKEINREKRNEIKRSHEGQPKSILRSGMVLLKNFLSLNDQIKIVKQCRDLGIGTGGFYRPGYGDGRELHLKMMCLGKNWDPETSKYGDSRPHDRATPPKIPDMFSQLVLKAIEESHALIRTTEVTNVQNVLPSLSPNICIMNFYTTTGRLGLHQDKDESPDSIRKGLPVVSFSIGDSAEFLYGDERDVEKAEKVVLESGDVLIFGGKSRLVFHGVSSIRPDTAPKVLLEETNLRPGRLNLTFREY